MLKRAGGNEAQALPARALVGRSAACVLRTDDRHVSGEHASLIWTGEGWEIRDLGSRNGTFVNGERLAPGVPRRLALGEGIGFGSEATAWVAVDLAPPGAVADDLDSGALRSVGDGAMLALPSDDEPVCVLFQDRSGRWVVEIEDAPPRLARDQEVVRVGARAWRLHVPAAQEGTAALDAGPTLETVSLRFGVSRDEEHVEITFSHRGLAKTLEAREHGYALLTLARQRLEDRDQPPSEQGWIARDDLARMLGVDANALNVAIYRARNQLGDAGVAGAAGLVEVRRGQRRIGVEPERLEVERL